MKKIMEILAKVLTVASLACSILPSIIDGLDKLLKSKTDSPKDQDGANGKA